MSWKPILIPKTVHLPTGQPNGKFADSGTRVAPSDAVEILPGSHQVRINGVEHRLLRPVDSLPLDGNTLRLDKPASAVRTYSGGGGHAYVARNGQARSMAAGDTFWQDWAKKSKDDMDPYDPIEPHEVVEHPPLGKRRVLLEAPQTPLTGSGIVTGSQDLDALLEKIQGHPGLLKGSVSYIYGEAAVPENVGATMVLDSLQGAFAGIHLHKDPRAIIAVTLGELNDALKIAIGDLLLGLVDAVKAQGQCAVVLLSPDWGTQTPPLFRHVLKGHILLKTCSEDPRFMTAMHTETQDGKIIERSVTCPKPQ